MNERTDTAALVEKYRVTLCMPAFGSTPVAYQRATGGIDLWLDDCQSPLQLNLGDKALAALASRARLAVCQMAGAKPVRVERDIREIRDESRQD